MVLTLSNVTPAGIGMGRNWTGSQLAIIGSVGVALEVNLGKQILCSVRNKASRSDIH